MWVEGECSSGSSRADSVAGTHIIIYTMPLSKGQVLQSSREDFKYTQKDSTRIEVGTYICRSPAATLVLAVLLCDSKVTYNAKIELH